MNSSAADKFIIQRNKLKQHIEDGKSTSVHELQKLEEKIADIIAEEKNNKAKLFRQFFNESNSINIAEIWKLKKSIWPKKLESLPNNQGHMVTDTEELKELYYNEFKERLRSRPVHPEFLDIQEIKDSIFQLKMDQVKMKKTDDWTMAELDNVLKHIQKGKSRDPDGLSREIFLPSMIGDNLKESFNVE